MILHAIGDAAVVAEPKRVSASLVLATLVTLAAVVPLGLLAWRADDPPVPASTAGLGIVIDGQHQPLTGFALAAGTYAAAQLDAPELAANSWRLYSSSGEILAHGETVGSAPLATGPDSSAMARLETGRYELLVTATFTDGRVEERAAGFTVRKPK